jgi:hypothetical protein
MIAQAVLATLLGMLPHLRHARCVEAHRADIVARADAAHETHGVPPAVLLVVGLLESHWGCNPRSGGCWGAPASRRHRFVAGTSDHAAAALARSYRVCGTWRGAVGRFRSGLCRPWQAEHRAYVAQAMGLVARLEAP